MRKCYETTKWNMKKVDRSVQMNSVHYSFDWTDNCYEIIDQ